MPPYRIRNSRHHPDSGSISKSVFLMDSRLVVILDSSGIRVSLVEHSSNLVKFFRTANEFQAEPGHPWMFSLTICSSIDLSACNAFLVKNAIFPGASISATTIESSAGNPFGTNGFKRLPKFH